jgi:hypothetical protein
MKKRKMARFLLTVGIVVILPLLVLTSCIIGMTAGSSKGQAPSSSSSQQLTSASSLTEVVTTQTQVAASSTTLPVTVAETPAETPATSSGMQLTQLTAGDFSSIEGVWVNGYGHTLTFGPSGLIDGRGTVQDVKGTSWDTVRGYLVTENIGGGVLEFLPIGTIFPDHTYPGENGEEVRIKDASDSQQERIWLGHDFAQIGDNGSFFYRRN